MHAIQLETDELKLVIRALEQHAAANGDERVDCEYLIRTLQCELDREARLERAVEAFLRAVCRGVPKGSGSIGRTTRAPRMSRVYYSRIRTGRRVILHVLGVRLLSAAAVLLDEIGRTSGDEFASCVAWYLRRIVDRYRSSERNTTCND